MESLPTFLGSKGLIKKHEFVRVIIQALYSLGYKNSATCLEMESGISYKTAECELLESQVLSGNWDSCIDTLSAIMDSTDEKGSMALYLLFRHCLSEYLNHGDDDLALGFLRRHVPRFQMSNEKVHKLASCILSFKAMEAPNLNDEVVCGSRRRFLVELDKFLPLPTVLPERRLEHLVETAVESQIDSCMYHNSRDAVSLYKDHRCGRDQLPTATVQILREHENEVWFVQFSNNGEYLASSSSDCTAIIWKVLESGNLILKHLLKSHKNPVSFVAWSADDKKLLTCGHEEVLKLWDVETGTCTQTFGNHGFPVSSCAWFPDSKRFVCGSSDPEKGIFMWDCDGNEIKAWRGMRMPKVVGLAVTPDGKNLISVLSDKEIRILNLGTYAERVILEEHPIASLAVSDDSKFFIVNLNSQEIHLWDVAGELKKPLRYIGHKQNAYVIRSCFGGLNSTFIASGSENSQVYIWNRKICKPIEVLSGHSRTVNCVSWNLKRPQMLASASDDCTIRIWGPK